MIKSVRNTFIALVAVLVSTVSFAQQSIFDSSSLFSNENEFLKVDQAFMFNFNQKGNELMVSFDIEEGYYIYKAKFKFVPENATLKEPKLPKGLHHEDEFFGVQEVYRHQVVIPVKFSEISDGASIAITYQGCADKGLCYPPEKKVIQLTAVDANATLAGNNESGGGSVVNESEQNKLAKMLAADNLFLTLAAFFVGGLLLSFTPCVFPMYPILTGIIVGQGDKLSNKRAFTLSFSYVQGMAITYTILGIVVALAGAQFQAMFQHPVVLVALSILFIFLALSMFGVFNLAMPSSWQNKLNEISNKQEGGSYTGVLSMGALSGLVASPCTTAPLTGALLYISQTGNIFVGASALYALSMGMGLPLLVLGSSGGKLLPKAGAWMNVIKNIFGLLLLAVPIFLLERFIDVTYSEVLWTLLLLASAAYFYTVNQTTDRGFMYGARTIVIFAMFFLGFQKGQQLIFPHQNNTTVTAQHEEASFTIVKNLSELESLVKTANADGKTVMVDLYADWCIACKEFEEYTFPAPSVQTALNNTIKVQIDLTDTNSPESIELMDHFEVFGLPSILFFDKQGQELSTQRVTGFMGAEEFANHINRIL
mgnify:CR=1 FL=1